jgi:hypothetical protein
MEALIKMLEKATAPSRELDALIEVEHRRLEAYAVGLNDKQRAHWKPVGAKGEVEEGGTRYHSPTYTASIDAALTLKPKDSAATITDGLFGMARISLKPKKKECWGTSPLFVCERASTPAIALCIAALNARSGANASSE